MPSSSPSPPGPAQATGSRLAAVLLSSAQFPPGFADDPTADLDSGGAITTAAPLHDPQHLSCPELLNDLWRPGFGETAMATNAVADQSTGEVYSEAVYQFASSGVADVFYDGLAATWAACHLIVTNVSPTEVGRLTVTPTAAPGGLGVQDFAVTMTGDEGAHLSETETVAREGVDVYMAVAGRIGYTQPSDLHSATLLQQLITNVNDLG